MKLAYAAVAAAFLAASPVKAQVVDLSTITCADFSARPADQMANIMFWLEGYYTEDDDPTTIDFAEFKSTLEKLLVYCSNNPTVGVLTAADEVMGQQRRRRQLSLPAPIGIPGFFGAGAPWQGASLA
jgi:acid stress chaperone HdeB